MGRPGTSRLGAAHPKAHGSDSRDSGEGRLDPVRWRRPARGMLLRLAAVAVLLGTAALMAWSPPQSCGDQVGVAAASRAAAASTPPNGDRPPGTAKSPYGGGGPGTTTDGRGGPGTASDGRGGPGTASDGGSGGPGTTTAGGPAGKPDGKRPADAGPAGDHSTGGDDPASDAAAAQLAAAGAPAVPPGSLGVPVRLADPTALALVRAGNRVDLLRREGADGKTTSVAAAALVLDVTGAGDPTGGLLLALSPAEAERAVADPDHGFAILIRPG